jgi:hypothetical protein
MSYNPVPKKKVGGQCEAITSDNDVQSLLNKILKELRILNLHIESMTDENIKKEDIV